MKATLKPVLFALGVATMALVGPTAAMAATTYNDTVNGTEVAATPTEGTFDGTAKGDLPGHFRATVKHTVLDPDAEVTGGNFTLDTTMNGSSVTVKGDVVGGSVILQNRDDTGCRDQHYDVDLKLARVGVNGGSGTGTYDGSLTHKRRLVAGVCVIYEAPVSGKLTLTF